MIGMAGGDGSQALVADIARRHDVVFVCVPADTRNHLTLDLGLDRADVVAALGAFGGPQAKHVDLRFDRPDGQPRTSADTVLVSNDVIPPGDHERLSAPGLASTTDCSAW